MASGEQHGAHRTDRGRLKEPEGQWVGLKHSDRQEEHGNTCTSTGISTLHSGKPLPAAMPTGKPGASPSFKLDFWFQSVFNSA